MIDLLDRLKAAPADRYTIERELGSGGMATVYLAEDLKHHRKVAVKVLRPELTASLGCTVRRADSPYANAPIRVRQLFLLSLIQLEQERHIERPCTRYRGSALRRHLAYACRQREH